MLTSPLSPPYSQLSGAVIFNLGSSAHSIIWHGPMRLEQPLCFEPTKRIRCPCVVTCGVLFPLAAAALEERPGRDMAGGGGDRSPREGYHMSSSRCSRSVALTAAYVSLGSTGHIANMR